MNAGGFPLLHTVEICGTDEDIKVCSGPSYYWKMQNRYPDLQAFTLLEERVEISYQPCALPEHARQYT